MNRSTPGLPVHHQLLEFTKTHVHRVSDAIQPSHPLSSPSSPAPNPSQHQSLFQWVNSLHEVAKSHSKPKLYLEGCSKIQMMHSYFSFTFLHHCYFCFVIEIFLYFHMVQFSVTFLIKWNSSTGVSALASFLPKKSQGWSPSEWTDWISLQSKGLSRVFSNTTVQKHQFFSAQPSSQSNSHPCVNHVFVTS